MGIALLLTQTSAAPMIHGRSRLHLFSLLDLTYVAQCWDLFSARSPRGSCCRGSVHHGRLKASFRKARISIGRVVQRPVRSANNLQRAWHSLALMIRASALKK